MNGIYGAYGAKTAGGTSFMDDPKQAQIDAANTPVVRKGMIPVDETQTTAIVPAPEPSRTPYVVGGIAVAAVALGAFWYWRSR